MPLQLAIVLLLNGVQVDLPHPALLIGEVACVPLRAVCERVGAQVRVSGSESILVETADGEQALTIGPRRDLRVGACWLSPSGVAYVSARRLAERLSGRCRWWPRARAVHLTLPWLGALEGTAGTGLMNDPLTWRGKHIRLTGISAGRLTGALSPTPRSSLARPGLWLRTEAGAIYCVTQDNDARLHHLRPLPRPGRPTEAIGTLEIGRNGEGVVLAETVRVAPDVALGSIQAGREQYRAGEQVLLSIAHTVPRGSGSEPARGRRHRVELQTPSGQRAVIAAHSTTASSLARIGAVATPIQRKQVSVCIPGSVGRHGCGVWRARLLSQDQGSGSDCEFRVTPPPHLARPAEGTETDG